MKSCCLVCKNYTDSSNSRIVKIKQRFILKSNCSVCGNNKNMFTSKGSDLLDSLGVNTPQNVMECF